MFVQHVQSFSSNSHWNSRHHDLGLTTAPWFWRSTSRDAAAIAAFTRARAEVEEILDQQPDYAEELWVLGMINAVLGKKRKHSARVSALWSCFRSAKMQ